MAKTRQEAVEKLRELIEDIEIAMMTTIDNDVLRSRPMDTQQVDHDGNLWFFSSLAGHKTGEIMKDNRVNVSYASPDDDAYVSVSGQAEFSTDQDKIDELWNPSERAWFPEGKDDPNLVLIKVKIEQAEYWDSSSSAFVQITGFLKAMVTGEQASGGENEKIDM